MKRFFTKLSVLLLSLGLSTTAYCSLSTYEVYAKNHSSASSGGLSTGLFFSAGDMITGFADPDDLWNAGALPRWSNADGLMTDLFATGTDESGQAAGTKIGQDFGLYTSNGFSAPYGMLVGSINNSYFVLGTEFDLIAPESGELSLMYWDSNSGDNSEFVSVSVASIPVPGALGLFCSALIGFLGIKRRGSVTAS